MHRDRETVREEALDALAALGNEHRIRILHALAEAEAPLSFSELRRCAGIDDTGQFNYHLRELCGRFVRDGESGYELGTAGERVVLATADLDPEAAAVTSQQVTEEGCPVCGERDCDRVVHIHLESW